MAPARVQHTDVKWDNNFHTHRRHKLFKAPPRDHTAYPSLTAAVEPHIKSFNAITEKGGILDYGLQDIGIKEYLDGEPNVVAEPEDALGGSVGDRPSTSTQRQPSRNKLSVRVKDVIIEKPKIPTANKHAIDRDVMPAEARERYCSYKAKLRARVEWRINEGDWKPVVRELGSVPIMLNSNRCHLENKPPEMLVHRKEESDERGGYFIINGNEKIIRMLIVQRRNYPMAIIRPSFQNRGPSYTKYGISIRCARPDQSSQTNFLHCLTDGNITFRFSWRKNEYMIPLVMVMKALVNTNDREIFEGILGHAGDEGLKDKQFVIERVELLLRTYQVFNMHGKTKTRAYLGSRFRPVLRLSEDRSDEEVGTYFLKKIVLPHLGWVNVTDAQDADKFRMLLFMARKLYALVEGECAADNPDTVQNQEILLGGFLYGMILKEKIEEYLEGMRRPLAVWRNSNMGETFLGQKFQKEFVSKVLGGTPENIGSMLENFLSTGNITSSSGLDLQQASGYVVVAEKINFYRFISHFRTVHRGSFFAELKTTTVRKLLPESWGFLCPVHTPDGSPCGLLNHLAHKCKIATKNVDASAVPSLITQMGASPVAKASLNESVVIVLDGRVLGFCHPKEAKTIADTLRYWKVAGQHGVPAELEIGYVPNSNKGQYPGIYMASTSARMYRPVKYLSLDRRDFVGPFEQVYMSIAVRDEEVVPNDTTHVEFDPTNILSIVANMTPFSDFNQSPRNMYQCQMGKQTMGTYGTATRYRTDNKAYRLQTGQTPIVRPPLHNTYGLDNFPQGTNCVVAVISYTGYDMDDAMIINKSAHERGFGYGVIYKTKKIDLGEDGRNGFKRITKLFGFAEGDKIKADVRECLDDDGIARVGVKVQEGSYLAAYHTVQPDPRGGEHKWQVKDGRTQYIKYKDTEIGYIDEVRILGAENGNEPCQSLLIKFRIPRSPVIGDKFSSRHGQKGVCSVKNPVADMPFSESGMQPDVIINPHAFPSRMTIGMFIESMAGKSGALHGFPQDGTPWQFDEDHCTAVDYFGQQLRAAGYNYYGNEPMYSGVTGEELAADIYIGLVYYQRLRHMVNDKFQVRTTGPVDRLTGQPVKGRKRGGGIRIGEMERDALLAHGAAFILQDRLLNCSDYVRAALCRTCGSFLAVGSSVDNYARRREATGEMKCRRCAQLLYVPRTGDRPVEVAKKAIELKDGEKADLEGDDVWEDGAKCRFRGGDDVAVVAVPGVLRYLDVELAAMGVRMRFKVHP
ncbi:MAG: DNA-directed RNA polymerase I subunit RPA2 [Bathelium mastoideum]|nr:MAG: DNA-directed RNA polymerase I subunit RPA2 [Bathelium mastoideum]